MTGPNDGDEPPGRLTEWDPGRRPAGPAPRTSIDPGRVPQRDAPDQGVPITSIDPGRAGPRQAQPGAPLTAMDPGRVAPPRRPDGAGREDVGLPPTLAARFRIVQELRRGAQADVFVVTEEGADTTEGVATTWVLKVYDLAWQPTEQVWQYLRSGRRSDAVVRTVETDRADGRCYELMEHLRGDDLTELRSKIEPDQQVADATAILGQLVDALDDMHANGIVHRDLTPANVVVRKLQPVEVAIVDFGISSRIDDAVPDRNGTPPYTSPQFLAAGTVKAANDFWALGILMIEFLTRRPLYEGLDDPVAIKSRVGSCPRQRGGRGRRALPVVVHRADGAETSDPGGAASRSGRGWRASPRSFPDPRPRRPRIERAGRRSPTGTATGSTGSSTSSPPL